MAAPSPTPSGTAEADATPEPVPTAGPAPLTGPHAVPDDDGPDRPARGIRRIAAPVMSVLLVVGAGAWALRGVDREAVAEAAGDANPAVLVALVLGFLGVFYVIEVVGFMAAYRKHLVGEVPTRDMVVVILAKHSLGAAWPLLTKAVAPLYFRRRWSVPLLRTIGASEVVGFADGLSTLLVFSTALAVGGQLPGPLVAGFVAWWALAVVYVAWAWAPRARAARGRTPRRSRWRESALLRAFARTTPRELAVQVALRLCVATSMIVVVHLLLAELGHGLPAGKLLLFAGPLLGATMVSIGGYGGPQGVAVLLLADVWDVMSREEAVAFSLVWSTLFLLGRLVFGSPLIPPLLRLLRPGTDRRRGRSPAPVDSAVPPEAAA